jgi:hypothetical protein
MNHSHKILKLRTISGIALSLLAFSLPSYAAVKSCCSHHGGVASCNVSGFDQCKDGSISPSCKCKVKKAEKTNALTTRKTVKGTTKKPVTKSNWWSGTTEKIKKMTGTKTVSYPMSNANNKLSGCCSHHGGVNQCNTSTGYEMCKDGTSSPTCKCP